MAWSALAFAALNLAIYLPYLPFEDWPFLRFLLPATVAVFVLFGAVLASTVRWARTTGRTAWPVAFGFLLLLALAAVGSRRTDLQRYALQEWRSQARILMMGKYLREAMRALRRPFWRLKVLGMGLAAAGGVQDRVGDPVFSLRRPREAPSR